MILDKLSGIDAILEPNVGDNNKSKKDFDSNQSIEQSKQNSARMKNRTQSAMGARTQNNSKIQSARG